ncbi:MAG: type IX secretion system sortase PorU [Cytophagaceae bacterium]|jgi:hypothetical protein|nr:type IX secretion system sortase PorU [Cytophagaceae bacterium]
MQVIDTAFKAAIVLYAEDAGISESGILFLEHEYQGHVQQASVKILKTENLSAEEQKSLRSVGNSFETSIAYGYKNGRYISLVRIPLLRQTPAGPEKLMEYSIVPSFGQAPPAPMRPYIRKSGIVSASQARTTGFANSSVLSAGNWYKVAISSDGIYKLDYSFFTSIGINPEEIDPRTLKVYGNGGGMLPQPNSSPRVDDLIENNILFVGESDGRFDPGDYVLFYATGPHTWSFQNSSQNFVHVKNIYTERSCYYITFGGAAGARITTLANGAGASHSLQQYDERLFYENDQYNVLASGREWYGETFEAGSLSRNFNFSIPNILSGANLKITSSVLNRSGAGSSVFTIRANGTTVGTQTVSNITSGLFDQKGVPNLNTYTINTSALSNPSQLDISYSFSNAGSNSLAHLNYIELNVPCSLRLVNNYTRFRAIADKDFTNTEFSIANANSGCRIWNVRIPYECQEQAYSISGNTITFTAASDSIEEYVIFQGSDFPAPTYDGRVENQNLHSISAPNLPDMVIITPASFRSQAERLASFKKSFHNLDVVVVTTTEVYNEFSSGVQDITAIRDFMKMLYDRKSGNDSIRYLLLFGDASYDYKDRIANNTNFVPCYQATQSLRPLESYPSDDYFGFLDNIEGRWRENPTENHLMDIGIGRLLVKSEQEASDVVDKIIRYTESASGLGKWRNRVLFVADDGDNNTHQIDAEDLANKVDTAYIEYTSSKVYLDASIQIITPGGEKSPAASQKLDREVERGALIVNYTGHGGEGGWAQEGMLGWPQIESWNNGDRINFMITATCEFGRFDNPDKPSGAEVALLRPDGGTIGLISSSRVVYQIYNKVLNTQIFNNILNRGNNSYPALGDVMRRSKNVNISGIYNRNYILMADPSLVLNYPKQQVVVTKINGNTIGTLPDTLKSLGKVTMEGEIHDHSDNLLSNYEGVLDITVFDKTAKLTTFGTQSLPMTYSSRTNFIFEGKASIRAGKWSISFVVPKDISYEFDFGRISFYAQPNSGLEDANGVYSNIVIGGTDPMASNDNTPPVIKLFMNDESFVNGGFTGNDPTILANLFDDNGINVAGTGIGHEITAELNNDQNVIVMNEYYSANLDDYRNGKVKYPLKDLSPGNYSLKVKAWDTHNNSSQSTLEFVVASDEKSAISHVLNYPNPFSTYTEFHFDHNKAGEELDIMVQIFTISGKLVKTLERREIAMNSHFNGLTWDGKDDFGDKIGRGVYVYKVTVRSPRDGSKASKIEKLVVLY